VAAIQQSNVLLKPNCSSTKDISPLYTLPSHARTFWTESSQW